ncbi:hypothetical protein [Caldimonas brevitalea]|uniref:hypothetical protein n=1 Tax=Caldimonas brevitalea TaxID=413882 RepID=UPI0012F8C38E|nr:hypothetical protein [Caldimonas brevitalea]
MSERLKLKRRFAGATSCRRLRFSGTTIYMGCMQCGGMDAPEAQRLRELEAEDAKL